MARALRAWAINRGGKNSVCNLRYGPRTRLVRGITNLVSSVRTVSYGSSFFPLRFMARALRAWAINQGGKNSVRNLRYGPRTRLVRSIYLE